MNENPKIRIRHGASAIPVAIAMVAVLSIGVVAYFALASASESVLDKPLTAPVAQGLFISEVLDQGEVQSSENVEFRCEVKSRYSSRGVTIIDVIEEGRVVVPGDVLVKFDSADLEKEFEEQELQVAAAKDAVIAAQNVKKTQEEALEEYLKGTFVADETQIKNEILLAQEEQRKAQDYYKFSQKLASKNYITEDQLQADRFSVERAANALALAQTKLNVLVEVSKKRMISSFRIDIDSAQSKLTAAEKAQKIEEDQLAEIQDQLELCQIKVPENVTGQVVYANVFSRRGSAEFVMEPGATVRERQVLIRLPNKEKMQIKAAVNESRITSIKAGMPVKVGIDALNGTKLMGEVTKVNQYAEPEGWGGGGVKKYAVYIKVLNPPAEIRPGMNASVRIQVIKKENSLTAPIQCIYGRKGKTYCLVQNGKNWEPREIRVLASNAKSVLIEPGAVDKGEQLALNPRAFRELLDVEDDEKLDSFSNIGKKSGKKKDKNSGRDKKDGSKKRGKKPQKKESTKQSETDKKTETDNGGDKSYSEKGESDSDRVAEKTDTSTEIANPKTSKP